MASTTLFPPIVSSSEPAFIAENSNGLDIHFSLSSLSAIPNLDNLYVHINVMRKDGVKVINTTDDSASEKERHYRATGIILNAKPRFEGDNYFTVNIKQKDLKSVATLVTTDSPSGKQYKGFIPGWVYKIQLRLSDKAYDPADEPMQEKWLRDNSNHFSEWSTICYTKAISQMEVQIPLFEYNSLEPINIHTETNYTLPTVDFFGTIQSYCLEANEEYSSVEIFLYKDDVLIEQSGEILKTELSNTYFSYKFKTNFINKERYKLEFTYTTENGYKPTNNTKFDFIYNNDTTEKIKINILTAETDLSPTAGGPIITRNKTKVIPDEKGYPDDIEDIDWKTYWNSPLNGLTSVELEEDEGRIGLKLYSFTDDYYSGNLCISRASMKDNFTTWEDIKIITLKKEKVNDYPIIYDYTIESGVWYKYAVQSISYQGERGILNEMGKSIRRIFNYSYLLGQGGKQLKLNFDNTINSFKYQVYDSKIDTIGSKYPFINRNAMVNYRTFPINGLISFWMDENQTFLENGKKDIYGKDSIVNLYNDDNDKRGIYQYDHTYERDFRQIVLDFLQDGKPKLFKSPTEGNIIVRLMDINCTPNQSLDRMIYSFSSNANEIDDATMSNYLKYGLYNPGTYSTSLDISSIVHLGQLKGEFKLGGYIEEAEKGKKTTTKGDNIFELIYKKYDSQGRNTGGYLNTLETIEKVKITIEDPPFKVSLNNNTHTLGNEFELSYQGKKSAIIILDPRGIYEFDSLLKFQFNSTYGDELIFMTDEDNTKKTINATIDFIYTVSTKIYIEHEVETKKSYEGIGEFFETVKPGDNIKKALYYKYFFDSDKEFRYLKSISSIEIEANPHTIFGIKDEYDSEIEYHEVGDTGILNLSELNDISSIIYVGRRYEQKIYDENSLSDAYRYEYLQGKPPIPIPLDIITEDQKIKDAYGNTITISPLADVKITYRYITITGTYKQEKGG